MRISSRFALDILFVIGGAFLAIAAMSFRSSVAGWLALGVSIGLAVLALAGLIAARRTGHWAGHAVVGLVALWSLIAALAFSGTLLTWFVFADAIALGIAAIGDLTANEISEESVVHRLEVTHAAADQANGRIATA
jgi:hypothetical protein